MSNAMSVSKEDFESSFINEEAFTIMKAISESTDMMLNAVRNLEKNSRKWRKRKSDKAVIFKLLHDMKDLKKTKTDKTIPEKSKRKWKKKKIKS